ncbi:hypothetical protein Cme02nite_47410 [Catellatospora methionotrophica]|uniref:Uncharacterized protein n=1 Tax=Catellatospora methionotrophica TaxID=121620 RepID=A0A8J3LD85_9ACTN|nr:hypothetical protein Cme02nite_47410 [Catellatospora methionotrophica]
MTPLSGRVLDCAVVEECTAPASDDVSGGGWRARAIPVAATEASRRGYAAVMNKHAVAYGPVGVVGGAVAEAGVDRSGAPGVTSPGGRRPD